MIIIDGYKSVNWKPTYEITPYLAICYELSLEELTNFAKDMLEFSLKTRAVDGLPTDFIKNSFINNNGTYEITFEKLGKLMPFIWLKKRLSKIDIEDTQIKNIRYVANYFKKNICVVTKKGKFLINSDGHIFPVDKIPEGSIAIYKRKKDWITLRKQ